MQEFIARELITKANQAILEAQRLRREGRSLRFEASVRATELGGTIRRFHAVANGSPEMECCGDRRQPFASGFGSGL